MVAEYNDCGVIMLDKPSTFAKRLRELLDEKGLSQAQLSRDTKISESSISHYLKGDWEGKQGTVFSIAQAYNISEAWLMGMDVPMDRSTYDILFHAAQDKRLLDSVKAMSPEALVIAAAFDKASGRDKGIVRQILKEYAKPEANGKAVRQTSPDGKRKAAPTGGDNEKE